MRVVLNIWRQPDSRAKGEFERHEVEIDADASFLEMLDVLNDRLVAEGKRPVAFDHDCREGICGSCGLMINGIAHGPKQTTTCQLHMRSFSDGDKIDIEPWRSGAFPVIKDLVVDRSALDRIIAAGGYISFNTGGAPDGNAIPIPKEVAELAMDSAQCIQCGACVAQCKNASAHLFTSAKIQHLGLLPQGQPERFRRVVRMLDQADAEGFGNCSNEGECEAVCPKEIPISNIARMYRDYFKALWTAGR